MGLHGVHVLAGLLWLLTMMAQVWAKGFREDVERRFAAYGWRVFEVADGNDLVALGAAMAAAESESSRPTLIVVRTHIGYGSPHKQDSPEAHGSPLGEEEVRLTKRNLGWP